MIDDDDDDDVPRSHLSLIATEQYGKSPDFSRVQGSVTRNCNFAVFEARTDGRTAGRPAGNVDRWRDLSVRPPAGSFRDFLGSRHQY